jgi:hypothetical protein
MTIKKVFKQTHWIRELFLLGLIIVLFFFVFWKKETPLMVVPESAPKSEPPKIAATEIPTIHNTYVAPLPPHVSHGGFNTHLDMIIWKANEDGLEYGTKMKATPLIGQASKTNTKLLDLEFEWNPGFCVGLGYLFNKFDYWTLNLDWTRIESRAHGRKSAQGIESQVGSVDTIIPAWVNFLFVLRAGAKEASAHWHLDYNTVDLDLGRSFFLSKRFALNPYFGLRGARLDQHYHANYKTVFILAQDAPPFKRNVFFRGKNKFFGFGLRGGAEALWHFNSHWHLFSQLSGNILYGRFSVDMKNLHDQGIGEGEILPSPLDFTARESFWRTRLSFEEAVGLGWETFFNKNRYHVTVRASYELSQWLNQNELFNTFYFRGQDTISSVPIRNHGDLSFHGVRAALQFDF